MKLEEQTGQEQRRKKPAASTAGERRRPPANGKSRTPDKKQTPAGRKPAAARKGNTDRRRQPRSNSSADIRRRNARRRQDRRTDRADEAVTRQREPLPEVVYMPPKQFNRNRFVLHLVTLVAVVLAITFVFSIFFKVKNITVSGAVKYDPWTIREASGIKDGEGLLSFGGAKAAGRITTLLPYVKEAQIGIKLPDTVKIEIVESSVAYSIAAADGTWWLISAEGKVLEQTDEAGAGKETRIEGLVLAAPVGEKAVAYEESGQNAFGETVPVSISGKERLETLKQIMQELEMNGVMGTVTSIDVTQPTDLRLWFGEKYRVDLGDGNRIPYKIECMQAVFEQEEFLEAGIIDVSFTNEAHPKDVVFVPFTD